MVFIVTTPDQHQTQLKSKKAQQGAETCSGIKRKCHQTFLTLDRQCFGHFSVNKVSNYLNYKPCMLSCKMIMARRHDERNQTCKPLSLRDCHAPTSKLFANAPDA